MKQTVAVLLMICVLVVPLAYAFIPIPGIPQLVHDPINNLALGGIVAEATLIYKQAKTHYELAEKMARRLKSVPSPGSWSRWLKASASDTYGVNGGWVSNANGSLGSYVQSIVKVPMYDDVIAVLGPAAKERTWMEHGTIGLRDGTIQETLNTVGLIRSKSPGAEQTLDQLESAVWSTDDLDHTEIAELQKIGVAAITQARTQQDANKLLAVMAQHMGLQAKIQRDQQVVFMQQMIGAMTTGKVIANRSFSGADEAIQSFQW